VQLRLSILLTVATILATPQELRAEPAQAPASDAVEGTTPTGARFLLSITGMTCSGCSTKAQESLQGIKGVRSAQASHLQGQACIEAVSDVDFVTISARLKLASLELAGHEAVSECPEGLRGKLPDPWDQHGKGLDVAIVSRGEEVDLEAQLVADKYTIIDFGAPWCAPCHSAAEQLAAYLREHSDVAVRAISLDGQEPTESYQQPVVAQHLKYVKGVPWFMVYAPDGRVLHKSMEVAKAMKAIDKHRKRNRKKR